MRRRLVWALLAAEAAAGVLAAASPWPRAYSMSGVVPVLAACAVVPVAVTFAVAVTRRPPAVSYAASLACLIAVVAAGVSASPSGVLHGATAGAARLFTDVLPLTTPRWLLTVPVVATWVTAAVTAELLVRGRHVGPPLAVLAVSYVAAVTAASGAPGHGMEGGIALLVSGAALAMTHRALATAGLATATAQAATPTAGPADERAGARPPRVWERVLRPVAGGLGLVTTVAAVGWAAVPRLPGMGLAPASATRSLPTVTPLETAPVAAIAELRDGEPASAPADLFQVRTGGPASGYLPVATLARYDGDTWTFDRTFAPTGGRVPPAPAGYPSPSGPVVSQSYHLKGNWPSSLPLVPFVDRPLRVTGLGVGTDPATGMVVPSDPPAGASYTVTSQAPLLTLDRLPATASIGADPDAADRGVPAGAASHLTDLLRTLAAATGQNPAPTLGFLQAVLAQWRNGDQRLRPSLPEAGTPRVSAAAGGTSLAEAIDAVTVVRRATPEQFATLFVVVARALGVPARLATGFRVTAPPGGMVEPGTRAVTDRQAWTWAEVPVTGMGWVVADPTPARTAAPDQPPPPTGVQAPPPTTPPPRANAVPSNAAGGHALAPPAHIRLPGSGHHSAWWWVLVAVVLALGIPSAAFWVLLATATARRALRRLRRRRGGPTAMAVGAWLEVLDALGRAGLPPADSSTTSEVVELVGDRLGPDAAETARRIGALADRAVCCASAVIAPSAATEAWQLQRAIGRQSRAGLSGRDRTRAALTVGASRRPLG